MTAFREFRKDGWPLCPRCGEDELYSLAGSDPRGVVAILKMDDDERRRWYIERIDGCYRCGWTPGQSKQQEGRQPTSEQEGGETPKENEV